MNNLLKLLGLLSLLSLTTSSSFAREKCYELSADGATWATSAIDVLCLTNNERGITLGRSGEIRNNGDREDHPIVYNTVWFKVATKVFHSTDPMVHRATYTTLNNMDGSHTNSVFMNINVSFDGVLKNESSPEGRTVLMERGKVSFAGKTLFYKTYLTEPLNTYKNR